MLGELDDEVLRELIVHKVEPAPDESRLLVTVGPYAPGVHIDPALVMQHLHAASAQIRAEVASAITRRRTPTLVYSYALPGTVEPTPEAPSGEEES